MMIFSFFVWCQQTILFHSICSAMIDLQIITNATKIGTALLVTKLQKNIKYVKNYAIVAARALSRILSTPPIVTSAAIMISLGG